MFQMKAGMEGDGECGERQIQEPGRRQMSRDLKPLALVPFSHQAPPRSLSCSGTHRDRPLGLCLLNSSDSTLSLPARRQLTLDASVAVAMFLYFMT